MLNERLIRIMGFAAFLSVSGCMAPTEGYFGESAKLSQKSSSAEEDGSGGPTRDPSGDPVQTVCDPLGGGSSTSKQNGLKAELRSLNQNAATSDLTVEKFVDRSKKLNAALYFSRLDVPLRSFTEGFSTQGGDVVKDPETENPLFEYFMLRFKGELGIKAEEEGLYQFALVSDDGSVLRLGSDRKVNVNNDGVHAVVTRCGKEAVELKSSARLPLELDYFQGPRNHIALQFFWRKVEPGQSLECKSVSARDGWSIVPVENLYLSEPGDMNPCAD